MGENTSPALPLLLRIFWSHSVPRMCSASGWMKSVLTKLSENSNRPK